MTPGLLVLVSVAIADVPTPQQLRALPVDARTPHAARPLPRSAPMDPLAAAAPAGPWMAESEVGSAADWDITHYDYSLLVDPDARTVQGSAVITATALVDAPTALVLHADGPVVDALSVDGEAAVWKQVGGAVWVSTVGADDTLTVDVSWSVAEGEGSSGYLGLTWGEPVLSFHEPDGARYWLVVYDVPHDKATITWRTTMPDGWTVVQNGQLVDSTSRSGWTTWTHELLLPVPPYLMVLHAGDFDGWTDDDSSLPVQVWAAPGELSAAVADLSDTADIIDDFAAAWGAYPWPLYRNIVVPFGGGMEHTTATTFGEDLIGSGSAGAVNAHEIAHHWWGDYLTLDSWPEIWLNEGFASHAEVRWYEGIYGEEGRLAYLEHQRESYFAWQAFEGLSPLYDPTYMWGGTVYDKGSLVLEMLRQLLGDEGFDVVLAAYAEAHPHGVVSTGDFQAVVEDQTGQSWGWFFDQWVYQGDDPVWQVGLHQTALAGGGWQVDLFATQANDGGSWTMPLTWRLRLDDGAVQDAAFWIDADVNSLTLCLDSPVADLVIDPDLAVLSADIDRDDDSFSALALTCGEAAADTGSPDTDGPDTGDPADDDGVPPLRLYPLACGGCSSGSSPMGGALMLGLLGLLGVRRRA